MEPELGAEMFVGRGFHSITGARHVSDFEQVSDLTGAEDLSQASPPHTSNEQAERDYSRRGDGAIAEKEPFADVPTEAGGASRSDELIESYNSSLQAYSKLGDFASAQNLFDTMVKRGIPPNEQAYTSLMRAYAYGGDLTNMMKTFERLKQDTPGVTPQPYATLIRAYLKHDRFQDAIGVFYLMKRRMTPDTVFYNHLLRACILAKDFKGVWKFKDQMTKDGCQPTVETYNLLIGWALKEDLAVALRLFNEMLAGRLRPGKQLMHSLLTALALEPESYLKAVELLDSLKSRNLFSLYGSSVLLMLRGARKSNRLGHARQFFHRSLSFNFEASDLQLAYKDLFATYAHAFNSDEQVRSYEGQRPSAQTQALDFLLGPAPTCIEECVGEALRVECHFESLAMDEKLSQSVRAAYFEVLASYNYFGEAVEYFNRHLKPTQPDPNLYASMMSMCTRLGERDQFYAALHRAKALLAPLGAASSLNRSGKLKYRDKAHLAHLTIVDLYTAAIRGSFRFGDLESALFFCEEQAQVPDMRWAKYARNHADLFAKVRECGAEPLKARLAKLVPPPKRPVGVADCAM
ncbi:hypothetical protein L0F63_006511 [Massospora cicadina]|nr:hypothetical protein L0F63_006511 [Massospora cicadina]